MEALAVAFYPNPDEDGDEENWQFILLELQFHIYRKGMSQKIRTLRNYEQTKEFDRYMTILLKQRQKRQLQDYLTGLV